MPLTLRLPLEVIERILYFALGGDHPPARPSSCWSELSPPAETSHLLLVSKGITTLALRYYWRSVTIYTFDDWIEHWHPGTGTFAGEQGRERASWVEEVRINLADGARLPLAPEMSRRPYERDSDDHDIPDGALVELEIVLLPRLKHVCFFAVEYDVEDGDDEAWSDFGSDVPVREERTTCSDKRWIEAARDRWESSQHSRQEPWYREWIDSDEYDDNEEGIEITNWVDEDWDTFDQEQAAREVDLAEQRRLMLTDLLGLDDVNLKTVRMPLDQSALSLMRHTPARDGRLPRITVYCSRDDTDGKALRKANLDKHLAYDFVKVPSAVQASAAADLERRHGAKAVRTWRWLKRDRTTRPLIE